VALTIAGSDSGGGAGIQADLKTFAALGVHGASAITCITAQNPKRVLAVQPVPPRIVRAQLTAVFAEMRPAAVKTGMLHSPEIVHAVASFLKREERLPVIVDPVMVSSSGKRLLSRSALDAIQVELLPRADLVTPNLDEAEILSGEKIRSVEGMRGAAKAIHRSFDCAVLVKGGHLRGGKEAADIFYDGENELLLTAPFVRGIKMHGTGCTYSAAITAYLALGQPMVKAVELAKQYITHAIARSHTVAGYAILNHFGIRRRGGN
jgi:hydroxymethylpyrimidine/phosphomethylpyrimidine kinase